MSKLFLSCILIIILSGCNSDIKKEMVTLTQTNETLTKEKLALIQENDSLKKEIDEFKNGASRLFAIAKKQNDDKSYDTSIQTLKDLIAKHPSSNEAIEAKLLIQSIEKEIKRQNDEIAIKKANEEKLEKEKLAKATSKMKAKRDDIKKQTSYEHKDLANKYTTGVKLSILKPDGQEPFLGLEITYYSSSWLFVKSFIVAIDDVQYPFEKTEFKRDNGSGGIWEWYNLPIYGESLNMLKNMIDSKKTIIRFSGRTYFDDYTITAKEKQCIQDVLDAFSAIKGLK